MVFPAYILADAEDALKLIFGLIVAVVWGVGALASASKKKQKDLEAQREHQENWQRIEQEMRERAARALGSAPRPGQVPPPLPARPPTHVPPPPPPVFASQRSVESRPVASRPAVRQAVRAKPAPPPRQVASRPGGQPAPRRPKKQKAARLPTAPPLEELTPVAARAASPAAESATAGERRGGAAANAAALSRWLTPTTLRSQFILTEILQPPLALRPPPDARA